jgi:hypothetical protein
MDQRSRYIDEAPSPFEEFLQHNLSQDEGLGHLIFSPEFAAATTRHLASTLCVTSNRWLIAIQERDGTVTAKSATFDETLLAELTIILLHGKVTIHSGKAGEIRSASLYFNTVMQHRYYAAICEILRGIEGERCQQNRPKPITPFSEWPQKFQNLSIIYTPPEQSLLDGAYSDTIYGRIIGEKAPAAALLLTEQQLIVIADERSRRWFPSRNVVKYGGTMSYMPRRRVVDWQIVEGKRLDSHLIALSANQGVERFEVLFSAEKRSDVRRIMDKIAANRSAQPFG